MCARQTARPFADEFTPLAEFPLTCVRPHDSQRACAPKAASPFTDELSPFAEFPLTYGRFVEHVGLIETERLM
mgnify:CR=1 FL=1